MAAPAELRARAKEQLVRGETAGGITDLKAYLEVEPDDEGAWLELGTAYLTIAHGPDALRALARAVELDGSVVDARVAYARALVRAGKLDDAAFQLLQASKTDETDARVARELGVVFYEKKLWDKAVRWLDRACRLAPADARAAYALGLAHEAKRDLAGAVAAYREALRRDARFVAAHATLADLYASLGEHERAIGELEAVLAIDRTNEQAAKNREILQHALAEMSAHRLLGKSDRAVGASTLVQQGQLRDKGAVAGAGAAETTRWAAPLVELWAEHDAQGHVAALLLILPHPERAAAESGEAFQVTVVGDDGRRSVADLATAASLLVLREALGCPLTTASALYARLLAGEQGLEWGGATLAFATVPHPDRPTQTRHGIRVALRAG